MSSLISVLLGIIITVSSSFFFAHSAIALNSNLGLQDGYLSPCPESPNCVVSQNGDEKHSIDPIAYTTDKKTARETLLKILTATPRTEVIQADENYILAESKSRIFGFVDDVEFYFSSEENIIHMRSASRVGQSDLGVNRRRLEQIRLAMKDLGVA